MAHEAEEYLPLPSHDPIVDTANLFDTVVENDSLDQTQQIGQRLFLYERRILIADTWGKIAVDRFRPEDREPLGRMASAGLEQRVVRPSARLVLEHEIDDIALAANVYATQEGVISSFEMNFNQNALDTEAAQESFAIVDQLGLASQWTNGVLAFMRQETSGRSVDTRSLNDGVIAQMNAAVRHIIRD